MRSVRTFGVCLIFLGTLAMAQTSPPPVVFPIIEQPLVPTAAQPGGAGFTLTINGVGFYPQPTAVLWREGTNAPVQLTIASVNAKGRHCRCGDRFGIGADQHQRSRRPLQRGIFSDCDPGISAIRRSRVLRNR